MLEVEIYPVGLLGDLRTVRGTWRHVGSREAARTMWHRLAYLRHQIRARNWRAVRNYFNGYLAEPQTHDEAWRRCGHGWTQKRALRDLHRHMEKLARDGGENHG